MAERNLSLHDYWEKLYENYKPELAFDGETKEEWKCWSDKAYVKLLEVLGEFPEKVPMMPEIENITETDDLVRERVVIRADEFMSMPCLVVYQKNMSRDKKNPAIVCCHGHGPFGKDVVAGIKDTAEKKQNIKKFNYNYGEHLAKAGFFTICPDLRGFGERRDGLDPFPGQDPCNVNFFKGVMFGIYTITLNIWDIMRCVDYLETRSEVDASRIGMAGLSLGGAMTMFAAAVDKRIKAACISGYAGSWVPSIVKRSKSCGSQFIPEIGRYLDTHDVAGLIAPRPLLYEIGKKDRSSLYEDAMVSYEHVAKVYRAARSEDKLHADIHDGGHMFANNKVCEFFRTYL